MVQRACASHFSDIGHFLPKRKLEPAAPPGISQMSLEIRPKIDHHPEVLNHPCGHQLLSFSLGDKHPFHLAWIESISKPIEPVLDNQSVRSFILVRSNPINPPRKLKISQSHSLELAPDIRTPLTAANYLCLSCVAWNGSTPPTRHRCGFVVRYIKTACFSQQRQEKASVTKCNLVRLRFEFQIPLRCYLDATHDIYRGQIAADFRSLEFANKRER